jgi:hypothetical protein
MYARLLALVLGLALAACQLSQGSREDHPYRDLPRAYDTHGY